MSMNMDMNIRHMYTVFKMCVVSTGVLFFFVITIEVKVTDSTMFCTEAFVLAIVIALLFLEHAADLAAELAAARLFTGPMWAKYQSVLAMLQSDVGTRVGKLREEQARAREARG